MKSNRNRENGGHGTNIFKVAVPAIVLVVAAAGLWLLLKKVPAEEPDDCAEQKPVEAVDRGIKATIFFDISRSMKGYADANDNEYLDVLSDLRSFYPNTDGIIGSQHIPGSELIDRIRRHRIDYSRESLLYKDLETIAADVQQALSDTANLQRRLNFYLTDGIMSGSNEDIFEDPEYNKIHAQDLQNQIKEAFAGKDSIGVSVYQFISPFVGKYWAYDNSYDTLPDNTFRYFYLIAVGNRESLADFKQKADSAALDKGSRFHPKAQWHAIDTVVVSAWLKVGPNGAVVKKGGLYTYTPKVINSKQHKGMISFNLDAKALTNHYVEDMDSLAASCIVEVDGKPFGDIIVLWKPEDHCLSFTVSTKYLSKRTKVRLTIPRPEPKWIEDSSNSDDKYMFMSADQRTFLFDKFMQGIRSGIRGASSPCIYQREVILVQQ